MFCSTLYLCHLGEMAGAVVIADLGCFGVCCAGAVLMGQIMLPLGLMDPALAHAVKVEGEYKLWCLPAPLSQRESQQFPHCLLEF